MLFFSAGSRKEGTGGREIKTKSTKKKGRGRDLENDSDDDVTAAAGGGGRHPDLVFMDRKEIEQVLESQSEFKECPEELIAEIASQLYR